MIPPQSQLWETWSGLVKRQPGKVAIHLWPEGETITFRELDEQVRHWSEAIRGQAVRAHDRVLVRTGNTPAFIAVFLACTRLRLVMIPLDPKTSREETRSVAEQFAARSLITSHGCTALSLAAGEMIQLPPETVLLKLTSGSTGMPRGVAHSEATLAADCTNICDTMMIGPDDLNLAVISLAHSYGFSNLVLPLVTQGTSMVLLEEFVPRAVLDALARTRATVFPAVPFMYECLNQLTALHSLSPHLRTCISADTPLAPDAAKTFHERYGRKIHSFYGCSECGGITYDASDDTDDVGTHVGTPMKNVRVDLVDVGRIRVRSAAVGLGYWPASKEDRATLHDGVFLTDDLGRFDDHGRLVLTGRIGNLTNVAAKK